MEQKKAQVKFSDSAYSDIVFSNSSFHSSHSSHGDSQPPYRSVLLCLCRLFLFPFRAFLSSPSHPYRLPLLFRLSRPSRLSRLSLLPLIAITIFLPLLLLFSPTPASAQFGPHLLFRRLSIEQGLSQNSVLSIARDRFGFMWFGTESGLNKYDGYNFTVYLPAEGDPTSLSNSWISALLTDRQGDLWVGTENGLNKYVYSSDNFIRYFHDPADPNSLSSSRILCLFEDSQGQLWIGTDSGLNRYDSTQNGFIRYQHDAAASSSLSNNDVRAIAEDSHGYLWVGTAGGGLNRLDPLTGRFSCIRHDPSASPDSSLPDDYLSSLLINQSGGSDIIWIGTASSGLVRYDPSRNEFKTYRSDPDNPASLSDDLINCLALGPEGELWIGTDSGGLSRFSIESGIFTSHQYRSHDKFSLADNRVVSLYLGPDQVLWAGTYRGISQLNFHRQNFMRFIPNPADPNSLSHPAVRAFCQTASGLLLVGTDGGGLDVFDRQNLRVLHFRHDPKNPRSLSSNRVFSIIKDNDGTIWIATNGGGLNHFNLSNFTFTHYRHDTRRSESLIDDRIRCLFIDSQNRFWLGTDGSGLVSFDRRTGKFSRPKITKIDYSNELSEFSPLVLLSQPFWSVAATVPRSLLGPPANPLLSGRILSINEDSDGKLWIASLGGGLIRYTPETGEVLHLTHNPLDHRSLSSNAVINVFPDRSGFIWAGTNGGGLNRLDPSSLKFTRYREAQGLPSSVIYAIREDDDGYLWFSSNRGLSRLEPRSGQIKNFDITDGLQDYEFNGNACMRGQNGYLYFGGINGFNVFNPKNIKINDYLPPVVITNFMISNVPVKPGLPLEGEDEILLKQSIFETSYLDLPWKYRTIAFEFAGLDYTSPEKNQYAYILEGFDKEWNYVGTRRFASYSNLPPGRYTFRVKATNSDGLWNEAATSLSIHIIPPFWRTWWFYGLCVLALLGAVYGFERYRLGQVRHRQHELERLVAQRTEELRQANEKLQFLATTDELTGLANYRKLRDFLEYEWRRARRTHRPVSLIICDLDDFKLFNDTYGHQAGDECLKKMALTMLKCCQRSSDLVCRYGGDEFAAVLPETDESGALVVAERIREAIACLDLSGLDLKKINGTVAVAGAGAAAGEGGGGETGDSGGAHGQDESPSQDQSASSRPASGRPVIMACLGVATMNPAEGGDTNELVASADEALYSAKSSGKNGSLF